MRTNITLLAFSGWVSWFIGCGLLAYFGELRLMWPILFMLLAARLFEADAET